MLRGKLTIKSHDGGKEGHLCNCNGISNHLSLPRGASLVGQLTLYLANEVPLHRDSEWGLTEEKIVAGSFMGILLVKT